MRSKHVSQAKPYQLIITSNIPVYSNIMASLAINKRIRITTTMQRTCIYIHIFSDRQAVSTSAGVNWTVWPIDKECLFANITRNPEYFIKSTTFHNEASPRYGIRKQRDKIKTRTMVHKVCCRQNSKRWQTNTEKKTSDIHIMLPWIGSWIFMR